MHVSWLELKDFRCYDELSFEPDPGVNVLVGDNGVGKTSVLEAIGYVGMVKSFRSVPDEALVRDGAAAAVVRAGVGGAAWTTALPIGAVNPAVTAPLINLLRSIITPRILPTCARPK